MSKSLPPCPTEDSQDCYWDAYTAGNGAGSTFANYNGETFFFGNQVGPITSVDIVGGVPIFSDQVVTLPNENGQDRTPPPTDPIPVQPSPAPTNPAPTAPNPDPIQPPPTDPIPEPAPAPAPEPALEPVISTKSTESSVQHTKAPAELAETGGTEAVGIVLAVVLIVAGFSATLASRRIRKFTARLKG